MSKGKRAILEFTFTTKSKNFEFTIEGKNSEHYHWFRIRLSHVWGERVNPAYVEREVFFRDKDGNLGEAEVLVSRDGDTYQGTCELGISNLSDGEFAIETEFNNRVQAPRSFLLNKLAIVFI